MLLLLKILQLTLFHDNMYQTCHRGKFYKICKVKMMKMTLYDNINE